MRPRRYFWVRYKGACAFEPMAIDDDGNIWIIGDDFSYFNAKLNADEVDVADEIEVPAHLTKSRHA